MATPLKLEGTNGDLKEMTTAEENYLAYQAGEQLKASAKTEVGAITDVSTGNETVGAFTDTRFDQVPNLTVQSPQLPQSQLYIKPKGQLQKMVETLEMQYSKVVQTRQIMLV